MIEALVVCLPAGLADNGPATGQHRDILGRFAELLQAQPDRNLRIAEICSALGVSGRQLRSLCAEHLGMKPTAYIRLRRMSLVRRALGRCEDNGGVSASEIARRCAVRHLGRFAANCRPPPCVGAQTEA